MKLYSFFLSIIGASVISRCNAFVVVPTKTVNKNTVHSRTVQFLAPQQQQDQQTTHFNKLTTIIKDIEKYVVTTSIILLCSSTIPSIVIAAVVEDEYEYGKVDAPIGIAVGVGILTILTALLPVALQGGEEAFNEMRDRDSTTFGKSNKDVLKGGGNNKKK